MNDERDESHDFMRGLVLGILLGAILWSLILWVVAAVWL